MTNATGEAHPSASDPGLAPSPGALNRWLFLQACLWLPLLAWVFLRTGTPELGSWCFGPLVGLMLFSFLWLWRVLGTGSLAADHATLLRFLLLLALCTWIASAPDAQRSGAATVRPAPRPVAELVGWWLWSGFVLVALGDLVDGWMARRFGGSQAGAILDMETDQFTLIALAVTACAVGAGPWPVAVPGIRYLFILAMRALAIPHHDPKPIDGDNRRGRLLCALVTALLVASLLPGLGTGVREGLGLSAALALAYSYSGDVRFLVRRHRTASS